MPERGNSVTYDWIKTPTPHRDIRGRTSDTPSPEHGDSAGVRGRLRQATGETVSPSSWHRRPLKRRHEAQAVLLESLSRDTPSLKIFARRAAPDGTIHRLFQIGRSTAGPSHAAGGGE